MQGTVYIVGEECFVNSYIKNIIWSIFHLGSIQIKFWFGIMTIVFHIFDNKKCEGKILPGLTQNMFTEWIEVFPSSLTTCINNI